MDVLEGNKLIAEFMGFKFLNKQDNPRLGIIGTGSFKRYEGYSINEFKFHSLWDWLIPVVEKIESIKLRYNDANTGIFKYLEFNFLTSKTEIEIEDQDSDLILSVELRSSKINMFYKAVVEFIKWYNKNK